MRYALIVLVSSLSATVSAQRHVVHGAATAPAPHQTPAPARNAPQPPPPPPSQPRTVAPPIVFPSPSLMPPPAGGLTPPVTFVPGTLNIPPRDIFQNGRRDPYRVHRSPFVNGYGGYLPYAAEPETSAPPAYAQPPIATGFLRLSGSPGDAQVFLDSYFLGTLADIEAGRALTIDAGPHRLTVRAAGYRTVVVDILITPNETFTYRASLDRVLPPPPSPVPPPVAGSTSPMYLIPNCYLGNVPPRPERLPAGCDIKQVQTLGGR
jgi:PEGA domain-containing protein